MIPIKTAKEAEQMRRACRTASEVLEKVSELIRPGVTTKEIDEAAADFMQEAGVKSAFLGYRLGHRVFPGHICISLNDEVVHGSSEHDADEQPEKPREITELRREYRADQGTSPGYGGEVMTKQHPFVGRMIILPVIQGMCRSGSCSVEGDHLCRNEGAIVAVGYGKDTQSAKDEWQGVHNCSRS